MVPSLTISGCCPPDEERKTGHRINVLGFPPLQVTSIEFLIDSPNALAASIQEYTVFIPEMLAEVAVSGPTFCNKSLAMGCPTIRIAMEFPPILESNFVLPSRIHVNAPFGNKFRKFSR